MLLPEGDPSRLELIPDLGEALLEVGEFPWAELFLQEAIDARRDGDGLGAALAGLLLMRLKAQAAGSTERWSERLVEEARQTISHLGRLQRRRHSCQHLAAPRLGARHVVPLGTRDGLCRARDRARAACERRQADRPGRRPVRDRRAARADAGFGGDSTVRGLGLRGPGRSSYSGPRDEPSSGAARHAWRLRGGSPPLRGCSGHAG